MSNTIITQVAVYREGAFVKRKGKISLKKGKETLIVAQLPNSLDSSTLTLSLPDKVIGSNVQVEALSAEERKEKTAELNKKIKALNNQITIKQNQMEMWNKNGDFSSCTSMNIADMSSYIEKLPERLGALYDELEKLNEENEELNKQLKDLNEEIALYNVKADLETEEDGEYPFELRYFDRSASWSPMYEIHSGEEDSISVKLKARIRQNTCEDWNDVKVLLYTGNPNVSLDIPVLYPEKLSFYVPQRNLFKAAGRGANMMGMAKAMAMEDAAPMMEVEEVDEEEVELTDVSYADAQTRQSDTMTEYELSGTWNVSKINETVADIYSHKIPCTYHDIAVPKKDDCAYLAAKVKTADVMELLETSTFIYHEGTFQGEAYLNIDSSKPECDISLGRDESVRLKRTQKKKYTSNVLLKGQKKCEYEYELDVKSAKAKDCKVTLVDQIPVSQDKEINVDKNELSGGKYNEENGEVTWEFDLEARGEKNFALAYSVAWPKDKRLNY
ncbi:MAG: DUF4139 domain-containing protein [Erysipelotrichaceae bacterium]|nr:DUF4139 domain-containing protein [Erysipelotrichaceae bacterium]